MMVLKFHWRGKRVHISTVCELKMAIERVMFVFFRKSSSRKVANLSFYIAILEPVLLIE